MRGLQRTHRERVEDALRLVGLSGFANAYPHQLSGGMSQRTALARALVNDPLLVHPEEAEERTYEVIGASSILGVALGAATALLGLAVTLVDTSLGEAIAVLGLCMPLLAIQDMGRYLGYALDLAATANAPGVTPKRAATSADCSTRPPSMKVGRKAASNWAWRGELCSRPSRSTSRARVATGRS